jgi:hypothetical protein
MRERVLQSEPMDDRKPGDMLFKKTMTLTEKNRDLSIYGHYFEKDGKRIDPKEVFLEMTIEEKNREVCEMLGCWHEFNDVPGDFICSCGDDHRVTNMPQNPNFIKDLVSLLREMMKREDWREFSEQIGLWHWVSDKTPAEHLVRTELVLDTEGKLLCAAYEFLKGREINE